jgi:hypothetical protein
MFILYVLDSFDFYPLSKLNYPKSSGDDPPNCPVDALIGSGKLHSEDTSGEALSLGF